MPPTTVEGLLRIELEHVAAYVLDTESGRVLVDTGLPTTQPALAAALARLGGPTPELVVLTHAHIDHAGGLRQAMITSNGAPVAAHAADAALLAAGETTRPLVAGAHCPDDLRERIKDHPTIAPVEAQIDLVGGQAIPGFPSLKVLHAPGHSAGLVALLWEHAGGILITGDAAVNFGQVRLPPVAEDYELATQSLQQLATLEFEAAVFGHGPPITSGAAAAFREANLQW
ncbi:MAG TPA: MBL fold metallo-hydrolase [Baekduia sp.]|nr:MBL fold metallo-hydrolase [Baekduia sp.]